MNEQSGGSGGPPLAHYLHVLRSGWWLIALALLLTTAGAVFFSSRQQKLYRASADVLLSMQNLPAALSQINVPYQDPAREVATQADVARTPAIASQALKSARLEGHTTGQDLLDHSSVQARSDANLLTFSVTDSSGLAARMLATAYAHAYVSYRRSFDTRSIVSAREQVEKQLADLRAARETRGALYASLSDKAQQLQTLALLQGSNATLVRSADRAPQVQPRTRRNAILGVLLGAVLGIGLAFLREATSTRVRSSEELAQGLDLTLLARVPTPDREFRNSGLLEVAARPNGAQSDVFHMLATNLEFVSLGTETKSILVTSATSGEGKSTVAASLSIVLARIGKKVILVDLDLRKPVQGSFFGVAGHPGLTQVLLNWIPLEEVLLPVAVVAPDDARGVAGLGGGSLTLLPAGTIPPNPAEIVRSNLIAPIFEYLRDQADVILIDAPPILGLSDTATLCAHADALIVVSKLPELRRPQLAELRRVLDTTPIPKLGFVATGANGSKGYASYGYGYGYGYGGQDVAKATREKVA